MHHSVESPHVARLVALEAAGERGGRDVESGLRNVGREVVQTGGGVPRREQEKIRGSRTLQTRNSISWRGTKYCFRLVHFLHTEKHVAGAVETSVTVIRGTVIGQLRDSYRTVIGQLRDSYRL